MKPLLLTLFSLLFYLITMHAQSYEFMYKNQPSNDSTTNNRNNSSFQGVIAEGVDTSKIIGFAIAPLYRKQPESPLGNLMADCMKLYAEQIYGKRVDAAFVNFSSMRSYIPKGDITIGTLFKVMPYNNKITLLTIQGIVLQQFLDHQASLGGWPCAGINMVIEDKKATDVLVDNQPISEIKTYTIAVADYIANGGNQCIMLKGLPQLNNNYLFRNALIDYIGSFTKVGKPITVSIGNRIVYRNE